MLREIMTQMSGMKEQLAEIQKGTDERFTALEESREKVPDTWQDAIVQTVQRAVSAQ